MPLLTELTHLLDKAGHGFLKMEQTFYVGIEINLCKKFHNKAV